MSGYRSPMRLWPIAVFVAACGSPPPPALPPPPRPAPPPPPLVVEPPPADDVVIAPPGALDVPLVRSILEAHAAEVAACHDAERALAGTLTLRLTIALDGTVTAVDRVSADFGGAEGFAILPLESCLHARALTWTFPAPTEAATVTHPFVFEAAPEPHYETLGINDDPNVVGS